MPGVLTIDVRKHDPVLTPDLRPLLNQYSVVRMQLFVIILMDPPQKFHLSATGS